MSEKYFSRSESENTFLKELSKSLEQVSHDRIAEDFPMYTTRQELTRHLARYELVKMCLKVPGSIVECGTFRGAGLMMFAKVCVALEPYGFKRKIIGFDTFSGFPAVKPENGEAFLGELAVTSDDFKCLQKSIELFDLNRPLSHVPKIELVKGAARETIPAWLKQNGSALISLLYLDFDLYDPTKEALRLFLPRMPKGAVLAFDELNDINRPGETIALLEEMGVRDLELRTFSFEPHTTYAIL